LIPDPQAAGASLTTPEEEEEYEVVFGSYVLENTLELDEESPQLLVATGLVIAAGRDDAPAPRPPPPPRPPLEEDLPPPLPEPSRLPGGTLRPRPRFSDDLPSAPLAPPPELPGVFIEYLVKCYGNVHFTNLFR